MAPTTRSSGTQRSTAGDRYDCHSKPKSLAGYLGLPSVKALKALILSPQFKKFYDEYDTKRQGPLKLRDVKIPSVYNAINSLSTVRRYGAQNANTSTFDRNDWVAHYIVAIKNTDFSSLEAPPVWDGVAGEKTLEPLNRVWMLMRLTSYVNSPAMKGRFWREDYPDAVDVPPFMRPAVAGAEGVMQDAHIEYPAYNFQMAWLNRQQAQARANNAVTTSDSSIELRPSPFNMPDPRYWTAEEWRDRIRRAWDMRRLNIDISSIEVAHAQDTLDAFDDYDTVQAFCRDADTDLNTLRFSMSTKNVDADTEIYERVIPGGLEEFYDVNARGEVSAKVPAIGPNTNVAGTETSTPGAQTDDGPDDFYEAEPVEALGFHQDNVNNAAQLVRWQRDTMKAMSKGVVKRSTKSKFKPATQAELDMVRISEGMQRLMTVDGSLSDQDRTDFRELITSRGAEQYLGPDHLVACDNLGIAPGLVTPQLQGSERVLKPVQIVGIAWMLAQEYGEVPEVEGFDHQHVMYRRLAMKGGIIADDMGVGKTIQTIGYLAHRATLEPAQTSPSRTTLILAPSLICYQWVDEIRENWPGLTVYLFHGRNDGAIGKKYMDCRILAADISQYAGDGQHDPIKDTLRHLFDTNHAANRTTIVVASYDTFKLRTGMTENDPEEEEEITTNKLADVFDTVVCDEAHMLRNVDSNRSKIIKALNPRVNWALTGTPMSNKAEDVAGILAWLWHSEWSTGEAGNLPAATLAKCLDLEYDIYDRIFTNPLRNARRRFLADPERVRRVLTKKDSNGNKDLVAQRIALPQIYELMLLRRAEGSVMSSGNTEIIVSSNTQPLQMQTVELNNDPVNAAEFQIASLVYTNEFLEMMKAAGRPRPEDAPAASKKKWNYPSKWLRRLNILASSLGLDRLVKKLERDGMTSFAEDVTDWRQRGIDYRWYADKIRTRGDPVLDKPAEYLTFIASLNEKLKYLLVLLESAFLGTDKKLIIAYDAPLTGLEIEMVLRGLRLKVECLHAGLSESDRNNLHERFRDPNDKSVQFLVMSMRISALGLNLQADCCWMVIYEGAINYNTEQQMVYRIFRSGQLSPVFVSRLFLKNSVEGYLYRKKSEKMFGEIVEWSTGNAAETLMQKMLLEDGAGEDELDLEEPEALERAAKLLIQKMQGAQGDLSSETPGGSLHGLKRTLDMAFNARGPDQ